MDTNGLPGYLGRVLDPDGSPVGTCFQTSPNWAVTARHVIVDALGVSSSTGLPPLEEVPPEPTGAQVKVASSVGDPVDPVAAIVHAVDDVHDLALLRLTRPLPGSARLVVPGARAPGTVVITGYGSVQSTGHRYDFLTARGSWEGPAAPEGAPWYARVKCEDVLRGMSGAPVREEAGDGVLGVVSEKFNSTDGELSGSVSVIPTDHVRALLTANQAYPGGVLVTNADYLQFVNDTGGRRPPHWNVDATPLAGTDSDAPVTWVSWDDALAYCDWAGGSLPLRPALDGPPPLHEDAVQEWLDAGSEQDKVARRAGPTGPLEVRIRRDIQRPDVGFRCVLVDDPSANGLPAGGLVEAFGPGGGWVLIPAGEAVLGTPLEPFSRFATRMGLPSGATRPIRARSATRHPLPIIRMSATCVTNAEYYEFTSESGHRHPSHWDSLRWLSRAGRPFPARLAYRPVVQVSAQDAQAFCRWSGTRLPRWTEWERAAAGPHGCPYPWGSRFAADRCNGAESDRGSLATVDEYPGGDSVEGVRQLCGNVCEWVQGPDSDFELRGGSYRERSEVWGLSYVFRPASPYHRAPDLGFRVVRVA